MTTYVERSRIVPSLPFRRGARYVMERDYQVFRTSWIIIFSGFFEPLFYLFAARVGIGKLVGPFKTSGVSIDYASFVAPSLMAASAMNGAVYESTMNIFFKLRYAKTYDAMLATPLKPIDIALGEIGWSLARGAVYAIGFLVVMLATGLIHSPVAILALPAALLIGFAFGAAGMAATSYMTSWQNFDLVNLGVLLLFLFSATFYPLSVYPPAVRAIAQISPLYHGVVLIRSFTLGTIGPSLLWHAGFLAAMAAAGLAIASARLKILLTP